MEQFGNELKKVLKAGLGAVATGAEKAQEAIETLSKKGEPLYQQAKTAVTDAADKIMQAVSDSGIKDALASKPQVQKIIDELRALPREDWALIRDALDVLEAQPPVEDTPDDGAVDAAVPEAEEAAEAPAEDEPESPADGAAE